MSIQMTVQIQYGPILRWPGVLRVKSQRVVAPFKSGYADTMKLLERELRMVSAESVVVQLALREGAFRRSNGQPYADAEPEHPGVIVSFRKCVRNRTTGQTLKVPLSFPADRFTKWESNLRAVAIALEDLRRIDRYGVTSNSEQYLGFKALPPPGPNHDAIGTVEEAARFVQSIAGEFTPDLIVRQPAAYRDAYRMAAARLHPDKNPDGAADWAKLQAAQSLLDELHGQPKAEVFGCQSRS